MTSNATTPKEQIRINEKKWGRALMQAGWTVLPTTILEKQRQLGLDAVDMNLLMQIIKHWWFPDNAPFPSKRSLAEALNVSPRTIQRRLKALVAAGFIERQKRRRTGGGNDTTAFFFNGLIEKATFYAEQTLKERAEKKAKSAHASARRGLKLV